VYLVNRVHSAVIDAVVMTAPSFLHLPSRIYLLNDPNTLYNGKEDTLNILKIYNEIVSLKDTVLLKVKVQNNFCVTIVLKHIEDT
jgi:hypothetical protein